MEAEVPRHANVRTLCILKTPLSTCLQPSTVQLSGACHCGRIINASADISHEPFPLDKLFPPKLGAGSAQRFVRNFGVSRESFLCDRQDNVVGAKVLFPTNNWGTILSSSFKRQGKSQFRWWKFDTCALNHRLKATLSSCNRIILSDRLFFFFFSRANNDIWSQYSLSVKRENVANVSECAGKEFIRLHSRKRRFLFYAPPGAWGWGVGGGIQQRRPRLCVRLLDCAQTAAKPVCASILSLTLFQNSNQKFREFPRPSACLKMINENFNSK